ncbi:MAG: hypothetical protein IJP75_01205 [Bacteroidaceae bacterium]|nr:hypothetical protein [Bacteroidaceae bacterium]
MKQKIGNEVCKVTLFYPYLQFFRQKTSTLHSCTPEKEDAQGEKAAFWRQTPKNSPFYFALSPNCTTFAPAITKRGILERLQTHYIAGWSSW